MAWSLGRGVMVLALAGLVEGGAQAQPPSAAASLAAQSPPPVPSALLPPADSATTPPQAGPTAQPATQFPAVSSLGPISDSDRSALASALAAARRGDGSGAQSAMSQISDPAARKLALWATVDQSGEQLSFLQLEQARRDLAGWPRSARRQQAAEKTIEISGLGPQQVIAWFGGGEPQSPQGAMALASAFELSGRRQDAQDLIRRWWRTRVFEADVQRTMRARFGDLLTTDDDIRREDTLLYGPQGPAAHDLLAYLSSDQRALAEARIALRNESRRAEEDVAAVPDALRDAPGLVVERAHFLAKHGEELRGLGLIGLFPTETPNEEAADRIWGTRKLLINAALRAGDYKAAYAAATRHGMTSGVDYTEAEFYAGWIALTKLHDPTLADQHFAAIASAGLSPITQARALYWRGRAAEALGQDDVAQSFFEIGGRYFTTFYGQLCAEKAGRTSADLGHDPYPSPADVARFNGRETVRAARMLGDLGDHDLFRIFVLAIAETLPNTEESALLVDLARSYGDQDLAMKAVRTAAQHGHILPERGYPVRNAPMSPEAAEPAMVFGITRQESGFDPRVRSGVGARGMMQLMPETAHAVARRIGEPYAPGMLDEPDYNMRLGASYLGHIVNDFSGSYVMAAAAYNAGPSRPIEWVGFCGDPRSASVDPVDFIECIPFSETRNYVMRVLEATQVYRARLNNGVMRFTLSADLRRGGYSYAGPAASAPAASGAAATTVTK